MAIIETGAASTGGTGTSASITHGLNINSGDVIIVTLHANNNPTRTDNNGANSFTDDFADTAVTASSSYTIFSRVAGASEPASYSFTLGSSERWSIVIRVFEGVHSTIYDVAPAAGNKYIRNTDPSPAVDAITTTYDRSLAFFLVMADSETNTYSSPTNEYTSSVARTSNQIQDTYIKYLGDAGSTGTAEVVSASNTDHALQHFALREASGLAITLEPTETRATVQGSFTVSNPATAPTTGNTTIALEAGGPSVAPDSVTGSDPYTINYTFPKTTNKLFSNTGYVHRITIDAESVDSTPIVYLPETNWNFVTVGTPDTGTDIYTEYAGGTWATNDQCVYDTVTDPSGSTATIYDTLNYNIIPAPTSDQTIDIYRIAANGTKDVDDTITFDVAQGVNIDLSALTANSDGSKNTAYPNGDKPADLPLQPSGFAVSYLSDTSLTLSWIDNTDNETGFELDRSPNGVDTWTSLTSPAANATSTTDTSLTVDTTYYYRLRAVNAGGASAYVYANGLTTSPSETALYPLEIIQPRAGLTTTNRFYKTYTGIEYNVGLGVIGGLWPFTYSLVTNPSGMTINSSTGVITWPTPTETGSPHSVTARVTDSEGTQRDISWTITVTTTGFKFLDATSGNDSNDGSIGSPWQTMSKLTDAAASDFIIFRGGNYATPAATNWDGDIRPVVWMKYPGETVNIDAFLGNYFMYNAHDRMYIDGFIVDTNNSSAQRGFSYTGSQSNITFRRNTFRGMDNGTPGNNPSYMFSTQSDVRGKYNVFQDNVCDGGTNSTFHLGYASQEVLFERNHISGTTSSYAFAPKDACALWFVRNNYTDIASSSYNLQEYDSRGHGKGKMFIEHNNFSAPTFNVISLAMYAQDENVYVRRNTIRGRFYIRPTSATDPFAVFSKNVIINDQDSNYTDRIRTGPEGDQGRITYDDNLVGVTTDGIVDASGNLQGTYRTTYLGTHGHEVV